MHIYILMLFVLIHLTGQVDDLVSAVNVLNVLNGSSVNVGNLYERFEL